MPPRTAFARSRVAGNLEGASRGSIQRPSFADGGTQTTWSTAHASVPVAIGKGRPVEVVREGLTISIISIPLIFEAGTDVQPGDRVVVGARTFQVIGPAGPVGTSRETARVVDAEERH